MRTYEQARKLVGTTQLVGYAGGRSRYVHYEETMAGVEAVAARLFDTDVVVFHESYVTIRTGGYVTPTTFDAIAGALGIARGGTNCGTDKRVPYVLGHRMGEGMRLTYAGKRLRIGTIETPLAPARRTRDRQTGELIG